MDMTGYVIHILHTFFILISWNYLFLECMDDVSPSFVWIFNHNGFPLKEEEAASHQENEQVFEEVKQKEEAQLELSQAFSSFDSKRQNLLEKVRSNFHFLSCLFKWCCCWNVCWSAIGFFLDIFSPSSSSLYSLVVIAIWSPFCRKKPHWTSLGAERSSMGIISTNLLYSSSWSSSFHIFQAPHHLQYFLQKKSLLIFFHHQKKLDEIFFWKILHSPTFFVKKNPPSVF